MPTPTEILEDIIEAYDLLYSAPSFGTVEDGTDPGDKYIELTVTLGDDDYIIRIDYRSIGGPEWMSNWTVTATSPVRSGYDLNQYLDEAATAITLLAVVTDYLAALTAKASDITDYVAEFVAVP